MIQKLLILFILSSCAAPTVERGPTRQHRYRCTSFLEIFPNDNNLEAVRVLLREGEVEIQRENQDGFYLSFSDQDQNRSEYMVTEYLADRLSYRYRASLLNCFEKSEIVEDKRYRGQK